MRFAIPRAILFSIIIDGRRNSRQQSLPFIFLYLCDACLSLTARINVERVKLLCVTEKLGAKKSRNSRSDSGGRTLDTSVSPSWWSGVLKEQVSRGRRRRESRRLLEGSGWGSGFCIVSMATPPDVLSNYHLVLPHATSSCRHSEVLRPRCSFYDPPKTAGGMAGNVTGYTKRWSLLRTFLTTDRDQPWTSLCCTHLCPPTHTAARRVAMKHLIYYSGVWKI